MVLQSTGPISLGDLQREFKNTSGSLSRFRGLAPGLPYTAKVKLSDFYGIARTVHYPHGSIQDSGHVASSSVPGAFTDAVFYYGENGGFPWATGSETEYNGGAGYSYTGSTSSVVDGSAVAGEWLQIKLPCTIAISAYELYAFGNAYLNASPRSWILAGSTDGSTWTQLDARTDMQWTHDTPKLCSVGVSLQCDHYRLIVREVGNTGSTNHELILYKMVLLTLAIPMIRSVRYAYLPKEYSGSNAWSNLFHLYGGQLDLGTLVTYKKADASGVERFTIGKTGTITSADTIFGTRVEANIPLTTFHTIFMAIRPSNPTYTNPANAIVAPRVLGAFPTITSGVHWYFSGNDSVDPSIRKIAPYVLNSSGTQVGSPTISVIPTTAGTWTLLTIVFTPGTATNNVKLYVNGQPNKTVTWGYATPDAFTGYHLFGKSDHSSPFLGDLGGVLVYNDILSDSQVADVHTFMSAHMGVTFG